MTQALDVIRDALGYLRVVDANAPIDANDASDALRQLNMMLIGWEADGVPLGWSAATTLDSALTSPPEADEAIGYNLAVRLRPRYGTTADPDVQGMAVASLAQLRALVASVDYARCSYPDLPRGNAQRYGEGWRAGFYR
jgi:hypothetical protein